MTLDPNRKLDKVPAHVPSHLVVDWDFYHLPGAEEDVYQAWSPLLKGPDVVWTPYYGGHWIACNAQTIVEVQSEHETFSHNVFALPRMKLNMPLVPIELDPPQHGEYRRTLNIAFAPKVIHRLKEQIRQLAADLTDEMAAKGQCDFVHDYARRFPVNIFLQMADLPLEDRERFLHWADVGAHGDDAVVKEKAFRDALAYLKAAIDDRRREPRDDVFSQIIASKVNGKPIGELEMLGMVLLLFFGGIDTVAAMMSFIMRHLATHPDHLRQLVENPGLIPQATDEYLRRFGLSNTARLIRHDRMFHGAPLKEGEIIMVPNSLPGIDSRKWGPNAMEIDFQRNTEALDTFGNGPHRCPGANLARIEIQTFLEEWLKRIPSFGMQPGAKASTVTGAVVGVKSLPLVWPKG